MFKGIIFDIEGVIFPTAEYHYKAWKELADSIGVPLDEDTCRRMRGLSRTDALDILLENSGKEYSAAEKKALAAKKNQLYKEAIKLVLSYSLSHEVKDTLDELNRRGYALGAASISRNAKSLLYSLSLLTYFDAVCDGMKYGGSKPNEKIYLQTAAGLGLEPSECLVVDDLASGVEAASRAGFFSAGIYDAAACPAADHRLETFSALLDICPPTENMEEDEPEEEEPEEEEEEEVEVVEEGKRPTKLPKYWDTMYDNERIIWFMENFKLDTGDPDGRMSYDTENMTEQIRRAFYYNIELPIKARELREAKEAKKK